VKGKMGEMGEMGEMAAQMKENGNNIRTLKHLAIPNPSTPPRLAKWWGYLPCAIFFLLHIPSTFQKSDSLEFPTRS